MTRVQKLITLPAALAAIVILSCLLMTSFKCDTDKFGRVSCHPPISGK